MNCRSSDPAVGRAGWRSEPDQWRYCRARSDVRALPHVSFFNSVPKTTQNIFRLHVSLANNGVGTPRARVNEHLLEKGGQGRGGKGRGGNCHAAATLFTARADVTELLRWVCLIFVGSASLCVLLGALNSIWAIDIAGQNWLVSVNFLPDTFVRSASPNPVVFSERFAFKAVSASAESEADPFKRSATPASLSWPLRSREQFRTRGERGELPQEGGLRGPDRQPVGFRGRSPPTSRGSASDERLEARFLLAFAAARFLNRIDRGAGIAY